MAANFVRAHFGNESTAGGALLSAGHSGNDGNGQTTAVFLPGIIGQLQRV